MIDKEKDETALFNEHYEASYQQLLKMANARFYKHPALAEEAVQETMLTAWKKKNDFLGSENPDGWLVDTLKFIMNNMKEDYQRFQNRIEIQEYHAHSPEKELDFMTLYKGLIPEEELRLLQERFEEGCPVKELARRRNISIGACKMRLMRARADFEQAYERKVK